MFGAFVMTGLCAAGITFNVRFLVALFREPKLRPVAYQLRMKLGAGEVPVSPSPRAARLSCHIRYRLACNLYSTPCSLKRPASIAGNSCSRAPDAQPDLPNKA